MDYYFSLIKNKNLIIFTFFVRNKDYNIYFLKISLFLCSFSLYFTINTLFFNDNSMHNIYEQEGKYDFLYQIPIIIYSTVISKIISILLKYLSITQKDVLKIKAINDMEKLKEVAFETIKQVRIKILIFYLLGFLLLFFSWFYLSLFCLVYVNTQLHVIKDTIISFCLSLLYPFGLSLLPGIFRIKALKAQQKDKNTMYLISKLIALI